MSMNNFPRGSEWRKWDLHVHTPASIKNGYGNDWNRFLDELEHLPAEFAVIGVNDYLFLEGYKILRAEKEKNGRLKNIKALFPVVEFRIKKFAGVQFRDITRVNLHIIFDPDLDPNVIESQFLNAIQSAYALDPRCPVTTWSGVITLASLTDLGAAIKKTVPKDKLRGFGSDLEEGFNNLNVDEDQLLKQLTGNSFLRERYLIGIGKSEWDKIAWDDTSIAEKKDAINKAHIVFTAAASVAAFQNAKTKLVSQNVKHLLLDCSDSHYFSNSSQKDRLGNCFTWIKSDPTFKGLLQLVNEPAERCFVGDLPPKLDLVARKKTKFIRSLQITRKQDAMIQDVWFDNIELPINPDLVAIIGNKGKGKSALTDIIGLLGNTKQHNEFTFLSGANFRQTKDNKARHFQATLTWESGEFITKGLEESVNELQPELIKYIPQNFLEKICTQIGRIEESEFDRELKKVIFSHIRDADRLDKNSLDELLEYKTSVATEKIELLKQELHQINEAIVSLEERTQPSHREKIQNLLAVKHTELRALETSKPAQIAKPENDPNRQREIAFVTQAIESTKKNLDEIERQITTAKEAISKYTRLNVTASRLIERLENFDRQVQTFLADSKPDIEALGLSPEAVVNVITNKHLIIEKQTASTQLKDAQEKQLDEKVPDSLAKRKLLAETEISQFQLKLDEPNKKYQGYLTALKAWETQKDKILGTDKDGGTIRFYEQQLADLDNVPTNLTKHRTVRLAKAKDIHAETHKLANTYRELYVAVNRFIEEQPLAREKLHLKFEVSIVDSGFEDRFFEIINRGVAGTFCGIEEGHKKLESLLQGYDFDSETGVESFLAYLTEALESDLRGPDPKPVRVADQIRKGKDKSVLALYDFVFSLDFLRPRYALQMGDKELHELSPGERGALLLVFYFLVDNDDVPLVIDQPEENLDNQTVYELLVPCMKAAKQRRQIFIVTHNPNLAVVCDAEQVICADLNKKDRHRMHYIPGSIENPVINRAIVDVLEGTMPAFDNRDSKYQQEPPSDALA